MNEPSEEQLDELDAPTKGSNKPLAWFFIIMILINPFLAPLLTVLLKANFEPKVTVLDDEIPEEPEVPWDFFQRFDRTLSFPMASAESLPQPSSLHRAVPEFLTGTTEHNKETAKALDANMKMLHHVLHPLLIKIRENPDAIFVLGAGEYHPHSYFNKVNIDAYLREYLHWYPALNIQSVHEVSSKNAEAIGLAWATYFKEQIDPLHSHNNLENQKSSVRAQLEEISTRNDMNGNMVMIAKLYDFNSSLTTEYAPLTTEEKNSIESHKDKTGGFSFILLTGSKAEFVSGDATPAHERRRIDNAIITATRKALSTLSSPGLVVVHLGANHLFALSQFLNSTEIPHLLLNFPKIYEDADSAYASDETFDKICFLPIKHCPRALQDAVATTKNNIRYCALSQVPYNPKKCDTFFHEVYSDKKQRTKFRENLAHQIPSALPNRRPKGGITDFFTTKFSMDYIKEKFKQEETEKTQRVEL